MRGEVRFDRGSQALYANDASVYRQVPVGVVIPLDAGNVLAALEVCREHEVPVLVRGCGTGLTGQSVNAAVAFDFSNPRRPRFLTRFRPPPESDEHGSLCPGGSCTAVWGVFPMRRYVLASDMNSGLWILRLSRPR